MSTTTSLVNFNFGGIRRKDSSFSDQKITCSDCQNVELFFTELNSGVGIRTANGNTSVTQYVNVSDELVDLIPDGEEVVGIFESIQDGESFFIVYTESETEGKLYSLNLLSKTITLLIEDLSVTGNACGTDFTQGWLDMFIFSNGADIRYIYSDTETHSHLQVATQSFTNQNLYSIEDSTATLESEEANAENGVLTVTLNGNQKTLYRNETLDTTISSTKYYAWSNGAETYYTTVTTDIKLFDTEKRTIQGLGLVVFDSRLWIFSGRVLWYSKQGECRDFAFVDADTITSAGYIEFVKPITAIYPYLGSLAVFHKDSSCLVTTDGTTGFKHEDESPGGCASYDALIFHGTDLYFYDDTKKGVFSFKQIVNGDKTLGDNIAYDIQDELLLIKGNKLNKIRSLSVVTADRNEVWFLVPISSDNDYSFVLIFDYIRGEWIKRKCQHINAIGIVNNVLYSGGSSIYEEYVGESFNGDFIESYYTCTVFNLGADNTLKITKLPPRATLDNERRCNFWVKYVKNYNSMKSVKEKELKGKTNSSIARYDSTYHYDEGWIYATATNTILKFPSTTFKALEITLAAKNKGDTFALKALEFSKLKVKQV